MTRTRVRNHAPAYLTPSHTPREQSPVSPVRARPGCDANAMPSSRPVSLAPSIGSRIPSLHDILSDSAPQPYTLSAFMAYLSQNHCLETLEFTMEADRYRLAYLQSEHNFSDYGDHITGLWQKLIQAYIQPSASREVNLPAHVRDRLLSLHCGPPPPHPSELDEAVKIVHELMSDSVLVPFVGSFTQAQNDALLAAEDVSSDARHSRSRSRSSKDMTHRHDPSRSPRTSFLPHLSINMSRRSETSNNTASTLVDTGDRDDAMDDADPHSPLTAEPMTPPTTPPTPEWTFTTTPPGSLHKAISAHSNSWKKVGAKLGLGRRSRSTHRATSSSITSAATPAAAL